MSAGEAQLLAFARVFLRDPRVVVLDEASSRIDPGTERLIERAVDRLVEGRTVIRHRAPAVDPRPVRRGDGPGAGAHRRARGARAAGRRPGLQVPGDAGARRPGGAGMSAWRSPAAHILGTQVAAAGRTADGRPVDGRLGERRRPHPAGGLRPAHGRGERHLRPYGSCAQSWSPLGR